MPESIPQTCCLVWEPHRRIFGFSPVRLPLHVVLGVIIPVFNEAALVEGAIARVLATPLPGAPSTARTITQRRLLVVDDGSTDGTWDVLRTLQLRQDLKPVLRVVSHPVNRGKGAAVRSGLQAALAEGCDLMLIHDADFEYDPADHARLLAPILNGRADAVIGTRFGGEAHRVLYFWHYLANKFITLISNAATNLNLSDIECCLKAFTRDIAAQLDLREDRFGIEPELVAKLARCRAPSAGPAGPRAAPGDAPARIFEVAVTYAGRTYAEGKKIRWHDGIDALRCILQYGWRKG
jgi:glycosyltransferase involved in cell wall biosynthesis